MSVTASSDLCYAFAWANGRIQIGTRLPNHAMPLARGPRRALLQLIEPRALADNLGLRVPTVDGSMSHLEIIEAIVLWCERLDRYNDHAGITVI